ncbi:MAG: SDR family oxidoreductase [Spirochaetales bacterium]|nr:SDR family oxidoreductase [Spirochaetales bacterium]
MNTIRVGIIGASGLLGRGLYQQLSSKFCVRGTAFSRVSSNLDQLDALNFHALESWLNQFHPDVVVNLAAERRPDVCRERPEWSHEVNVTLPANLARICQLHSVPLLHLSTNYVFDGQSPPYHPEDQPHPINDYGRDKNEADQLVLKASSLHHCLRVPMLHGLSENLDESSVTTMLSPFFAHDGHEVFLDDEQIRYPAFVPDVAKVIEKILVQMVQKEHLSSFIHYCPEESFTKLEMGCIMLEHLGYSTHRLLPSKQPPKGAPRPHNVQLSCPYLKNHQWMNPTPFREAIGKTLDSLLCSQALQRAPSTP